MLTPIDTNLPSSPVKVESPTIKDGKVASPIVKALKVESPTLKAAKSFDTKKLDVEAAAKAKSIKESTKARKESKGPILKRKMACATCRRRKLRCDAARPRCSTCARSQASAEAAGHPSAVPPGCCVYDADQTEEPAANRFFTNGAFHSLTFHSHPRMPLTPGYNMPGRYDASFDTYNSMPPLSPHGAWPMGDYPPTPSRGAPCNSPSCHSTSMLTTPTRPQLMRAHTSTPMRRIISPTLTINSTPIQDHDIFYSTPSQDGWNTPGCSSAVSDSMYFSPMVHSMSEGFPVSSMSSATSTPLLNSARALRSPYPSSQDLGTPLSIAPSTPCSETFDVNSLGAPMMPRPMFAPQEMKQNNFLQSMEPAPYGMVDMFSPNHMMMASPTMEIAAGNDLGLVNGAMDGKLQDAFSSNLPLDMDPTSLMNLSLDNVPDYFQNAMSTNEWTV